MSFRFDFVVRSDAGQLVLAIEAKAKLGTDVAWAREMRERIASRSPTLLSMALLLITPDRMYVWKSGEDSASPPSVLDSSRFLATYFARAGVPFGRPIDGRVFEDVVHWWLQDVATGVCSPPTEPSFAPVANALLGGRLFPEIAA